MLIKGMYGMGDNIYQRAFVREIKSETVYIETPWPQIYYDLRNVRPVKIYTKLRTHSKNVDAQDACTWYDAPNHQADIKVQYQTGPYSLGKSSILDAMRHCFGFDAKVFDLPKFDRLPIEVPYAVIRPVTIRREWKNTARNPNGEYLCEASKILRENGFRVILIADLKTGEEWIDGPIPESDISYLHGELTLEKVLGLIQGAALVVGGVGWVVPAAIALKVPLICIQGGQGGLNAPEKITGAPMDLSRVKWILPDNFCRCDNRAHACNKTISQFKARFEEALRIYAQCHC